jgi:enediyne biosynthesis protein E4
VKVQTDRKTLTQYHDGKLGYLSQSSAPLYFGLGDATKIDKIEVRWPSGQTQILDKGLGPNRSMTIKEPQ